ncbi:MAG: LptF/LptG family permease, partial [Cohaesibacter sp.]|nr:LptF/LptG family permease [Cohaesibacter sp.]
VLCGIVWLTQALRDLDLVTAKGQTILIFLSMTSLVLPTLVMVIAPFAILIAVAHSLNRLNADSELVVINATGARPWTVAKPLVILGIIATVLGGSISLYFSPKALGTLRLFITQVRADLVSNIVKEGLFTEIEDGMTFHIQKREPNGIMHGLFLSDERDPKKHIVYSSELAQIIENQDGTFLRMTNGIIQQRHPADLAQATNTQNASTNQPSDLQMQGLIADDFGSVNIVKFDSYIIDLSKFTGIDSSKPQFFKPRERPTDFFFNPDPDDFYFKNNTGHVRSELHDRFSNPLYNMAFVTIIMAFLMQVRTTRERRSDAIIIAVTCAAALRLLGFAATSLAITTPLAIPFMYGLPLLGIVFGLWISLTGKRVEAIDNLIQLMEYASERIRQKVKKLKAQPSSSQTG